MTGVEIMFLVESSTPENSAISLTATTDDAGVAGILYTRSHPGQDRITAHATGNSYIRAVATKEWVAAPAEAEAKAGFGPRRAAAAKDRVEVLLEAVAIRLRANSMALTRAVDHRGEAGRAREMGIAEELRVLLPTRFGVTRGAILGRAGHISPDQDLLVCDFASRGGFPYDGGHLVVPESVYAAFQVRTNLAAADIAKHAAAAAEIATFIEDAVGAPWPGLYCVVAHRLDGSWGSILDRYHDHVLATPHGQRLALLVALDAGVCFDQKAFADIEIPAFLAGRSQVLGSAYDAVAVTPRTEPFVDFYRLLLRGLQRVQLPSPAVPMVEATDPSIPAIDPAAPFVGTQFAAAFAGRSIDLTLLPGQSATFTLFYANVGTQTWERGTGSQCDLMVADPPGHRTPFEWVDGSLGPSAYATHTQTHVRPGSIGTFTFNVSVPAGATPGNYRFYSRPAIAGAGIVPEAHACIVRVARVDARTGDAPQIGG